MELIAPYVPSASFPSKCTQSTRNAIDIEGAPPKCDIVPGTDLDSAFASYEQAVILFMQVNVRDLRVLDRLPHLRHLVNNQRKKVDVLAVAETWLRDSDEASCYTLEDFIHISSTRSLRLGGGVSVFVRSCWCILEHSEKSSACDSVQIVKVILSRGTRFFTVIAFYSRAYSSIEELLNMLEHELLSVVKGTVIVLGDANVDLFNVDVAMPYVGFMAAHGLVSCISQPTRPSSGTCIDHIWIGGRPESFFLKAGVIETCVLADHYPTILSVFDTHGDRTYPHKAKTQFLAPRRIFSSANFQRFFENLQEIDWSCVLVEEDVDAAFGAFEKILFERYDNCFPVRLLTNMSPSFSPWYTSSLRKMRRNLDKLHAACRAMNNPSLRKSLNWYRREYRRLVKSQCRMFHSRAHLRMKEKPQALWQHINKCVGRRSKKQSAPDRLRIGEQQVEGPVDVAEAFCEYFCKIGDVTVAGMTLNAELVHDIKAVLPSAPYFSLRGPTRQDILNEVKHMKADYKGSIASVPSKVIKQCIGLLLVPLHYIFNKSIDQGRFPLALKKTICVPVYKGKGDPLLPSNYRPIALTPFCAKLFERCVKLQLELHLDKIGFFSQTQFGFRARHSTEMALCKIAEHAAANCEGGHGVVAVFLDVTKAFDCLSHEMLVILMRLAKFSEPSIEWFQSFLCRREIAVSVRNVVSPVRPINRGVPQGSVLGPFLFIFYVNPLLLLIERDCPELLVVAYADDTTLLFHVKKGAVPESLQLLNRYLTHIHNLFKGFMLAINFSKTKLMFFKSSHCGIELPSGQLTVNGVALETSPSAQALGLTFSADLKWRGHYGATSRKCYGIIATLARLRQLGHGSSLLIAMYKSLLEPVLFYGIPIWGTTHENVLRKFQVVQNDALRAITGLKRYQSVRGIFAQEKLLTVKSMVKFKICVLMFKKQTEGLALDVDCTAMPSKKFYSLRSEGALGVLQPFCRSVLRQQGPKVSFVKIWNSLPLSIKKCRSLANFKKNLHKHLVENDFKEF